MPLCSQTFSADCNTRMGIWQMTESLAELESAYVFKRGEYEVYSSFRNDKRRREWLTVRLLLSHLLSADAHICYRESGKPYLKDNSYCISITHTIGYVGVRLASQPVGIDMEYRSERVLRLIPRFVSEGESKFLNPQDIVGSALVIWSAKETLFKLFDISDVDFSEHLFVSGLNVKSPSGSFWGHVCKDGFQAKVRLHYFFQDNIIVVYC